MIRALDSSQPPTRDQAFAARAAGYGMWNGYLATQGQGGSAFNLLHVWTRADFQVVQDVFGVAPIGYCSGRDDPAAVAALGASWGVRPCLDDEDAIRADGPWVQPWLDASRAGLYGTCGLHAGRVAAFHVLAWYLPNPPVATWYDAGCSRPPGPVGWQSRGSHVEFGVVVDSGRYDDWFGAWPPQGGSMLARCPDTVGHPRRFDACFVRQDGHVMHLYSENGMVGLAQDQNLIDLGQPASHAVPGPAWCIWEDGTTLSFVVEELDGSLWLRQESITGQVLVDWSVFGLAGQAVGLGIPGPVGPEGPPGPPSAVVPAHVHPVSVTGGTGQPA